MLTRIILPILAVAGLLLAVFMIIREGRPTPPTLPVVQPAAAPFPTYVAGAGLVEASTENIAVGTHIPGLISRVHVRPGQRVEAGDPLFTIDDRAVVAELETRRAALATAEAELARLRALPRPEDVPPVEARLAAERASLADLERQLAMWESADRRAIADEELSKRRFAVAIARARVQEVEAELERLRAGAWAADLEIAAAEVAAARAAVDAAQTEVDRHTVRAPVAGEILKLDARPGEFAPATVEKALIIMGETRTLHVRVDVDENDAWRVREGAAGKAFVRGNPNLHTDLRFVRFEPYVIPKVSLTGASTERVDTRVLQVIFAFDPATLPVFVGQQMDVFIDAPSASAPPAASGSTPVAVR